MPHKEYKTAEKLLESIYAGNNLANKKKRDKTLQEQNFPKNTKFSDINLEQEFKVQDDHTAMLGRSILIHAIKTYNKPAVKCLLKARPTLSNFHQKGEFHPLFVAAQIGSIDIVKLLIKHGADPYSAVYKYKKDHTDVLMMTVMGNHTDIDNVYQAIMSHSDISKEIKSLIKKIEPQEDREQQQKVIFSSYNKQEDKPDPLLKKTSQNKNI